MDAREYKSMIQGRVNKAQGKIFEEEIEKACAHYRSRGIAYIEKNHEPFTIIRPTGRGQFLGYFAKAAQTDYTGVLKGGRAVCFEAKHTMTDRLQQDRVEAHQAADLDEKEALGALCFVVCAIDREAYTVPWQVWKTMKENFGHKFMTKEDGKPYRIEREKGVLLFLKSETI